MSADFFARGYSTFVAYLAEPAARSFLIGCAAAAALTAFRVKRVGTRLLVWTAVLCAALAMPFLGALLPRVPVKLPAIPLVTSLQAKMNRAPVREPQRQTSAFVSVLHDAVPVVHNPAIASGPSHALFASAPKIELAPRKTSSKFAWKAAHRDSALLVAFAPSVAPRLSSSSTTSISPSSGSEAYSPSTAPLTRNASRGLAIPWTALLLVVYFVGAALLLARLLIGTLFSRRLERAAQAIDAANNQNREALRLLRFRSCIAGLAKPPRLKESALLAVPATLGIRRAAILLPADWRAWSEEQLDAVLAHEISHVARRDALTQLLSLIHRAFFWFNPLSWWLDHQLTDLAEQASDEAALAGGADRTRYAETLLAFFAQLAASRRRVWWQGVAMAKHERKAGSAERRVNRILAWNGAMSMKKSVALAVITLAVPLIFLAASVHPSFIAHAQDAPKPLVKPANVIAPGGPVAPALPDAPKGGVKGEVVAPAMPLAPRASIVAPAPMGTPPATAPLLPNAPRGGVDASPNIAPALGPAPVAPSALNTPQIQIHPTPLAQIGSSALATAATLPGMPRADGDSGGLATAAPMAGYSASVPYSSYSPYASMAPLAVLTPQAAVAAEDSARAQDVQAQLQAAQDALEKANQASKAVQAEQVRAVLKAVAQIEQESDEINSAQILAAQHALEKANKIMEQGYASQMLEAKQAMAEAKRDLQEADAAQQEAARSITINGSYNMGPGGRYVIMTGNGESVEMSGDDEDVRHAQELRKKLGKDLIWFERDEKSYVITDSDFIAKAKALFAPEDALSKQQDELSRQQDALSKQQDALSEKMDSLKVKVPDITPDLQRINAELDALRNQDGATQSELGRLQSELGQLQSQVGRFQSDAGVQQSDIGRQQGELGRQQGELGRRQGELGRQQGEIARQASRQLRQMLDDAIANGIAKPE